MDFTLVGRLILHFWPYVVSVRQIKGLPPASFSPCLTTRTLPLAMRLPLLGSSRDFHPLTHAHAEHTEKTPQSITTLRRCKLTTEPFS